MMIAGLRAMLTTTEIAVVGEAASLAEITIELPTIDVIVVDQLLLDEVVRAIANDGRVALVVLTNADERPLAILRSGNQASLNHSSNSPRAFAPSIRRRTASMTPRRTRPAVS